MVVDACMNSDPLQKAERNEAFKAFLIELAIAWTEEKFRLQIARGINYVFDEDLDAID